MGGSPACSVILLLYKGHQASCSLSPSHPPPLSLCLSCSACYVLLVCPSAKMSFSSLRMREANIHADELRYHNQHTTWKRVVRPQTSFNKFVACRVLFKNMSLHCEIAAFQPPSSTFLHGTHRCSHVFHAISCHGSRLAVF